MSRNVDLIVDSEHFDVMVEERRMVLMVAIVVVTGRVHEDFVLVVYDEMIEELQDDIFLIRQIGNLFEGECRISVAVMVVVMVKVRSALLHEEVRDDEVDWRASSELNL